MYVYEEFNDGLAYGEKLTIGFLSEDDACNYLKLRVENQFQTTMDELKENCNKYDDDEIVEKNYVRIATPKGYAFFTVEPLITYRMIDDACHEDSAVARIKVPNKGTFEVYTSPEDDYPGVDVEFHRLNSPIGMSEPRIVFEVHDNLPDSDEDVHLHVWNNPKQEDPTELIRFQ